MRRGLVILVLMVVVAGAAYLLSTRTAPADSGSGAQLQTATVRRDELVVTVRVTGNVEPARTVRLTFDASGPVEAVFVTEGQRVEAGQALAQLDDELQRIAVEQAALGVQIAELNLASLETGPDETDLTIARANVNSAWAAYVELRDNSVTDEQVRAAELRYEQALAAWDAAEQASRDALRSEASLAQVGQASFSAEIARLQLEQVREGPPRETLNSAQARVAQAQAVLQQVEAGPLPSELERAAISVRQATLALQRAQEAHEDTVLRAPFAGVVSAVNIQAGGIAVAGGFPAVEIADLSELVVTVLVDEIEIVEIRSGQEVELTFDALPGRTYTGSVARIAETPVQSGGVVSYAVEIVMAEAAPEVRAGMTTAVTIVLERLEDVLVVPNLYVRLDRSGGRAYVNVLDASGQVIEREVVLGAQNESLSEVREGLLEGDTVAIDLTAGGLSSFFEGN